MKPNTSGVQLMFRFAVYLLLLLSYVHYATGQQWQNGWDAVLDVSCGSKAGFKRVQSVHHNYYEDRRWLWECHDVASTEFDACYWTGYLNWFDYPIYIQCEPNYVLSGVYSYHHNYYEDRRWKIKCCKATNHFVRNCEVSDDVNSYDTAIDYSVSAPRVFTGMFSAHKDSTEDRIWAFQTCEYYQCSGGLTCESIDDACEHITNPGSGGTYTCSCYTGYTLSSNGKSCTDIDECATNNGGCTHTCVNAPGSFHCFCDDGYTLDNNTLTCIDTNECEARIHGCQQTCTNSLGSYKCSCNNGYILDDNNSSCSDIDECKMDNGQCQQTCINVPGTYNCSCLPGYLMNEDGQTCEDINECADENGGCEHNCHNQDGSFYCSCDQGYTINEDHLSCDDIDECSNNDALCNHKCYNTPGSYTCGCEEGYALDSLQLNCNDINECDNANGGCAQFCANTEGSYFCSCDLGYILFNGMNCTDIDECLNNNGGCEKTCVNSLGSYMCVCPDGYTADKNDVTTCVDINECQNNNGRCEHTCINTDGTYNCVCNVGYELLNDIFCIDIDECKTDNNGGCDHTCVNSIGSYACSCNSGYQLDEDGHTCSDFNECSINNGGCEHICTNVVGNYSCSCMDGYDISNTMFCSDTKQSYSFGERSQVELGVIIPLATVICLGVTILAVVITIFIMKRRVADGKGSQPSSIGVHGLYPEDTGSSSPKLNKYDPDSVSMSSLKKVLEEDVNY